ncbi:MAG TPA: 2,5-diamino-6-(ribosylamino)-4(3H)-pyrimidinone 5'-phosphate reductase [Methanomicrobiales archaeon]|nr:2,5-diamino-6-(ribosylamino)-4(3H)-pyrimidinone 5'-phosphate reductase [Methanomicrobiales archaeon]
MERSDPPESRGGKEGEQDPWGPLRRPYVIVNMAMSADGKISSVRRKQVRISGTDDRGRVDELKAESDAVMVGIGTVLADNPSLTVKSPDLRKRRVLAGKAENPVRIVIDGTGRTPLDADILHKGEGERIIAVSDRAGKDARERFRGLATVIAAGGDEVDLPLLMARLSERGIGRLMVEGGGTLIASLFRKGLVDEFSVFIGDLIIGGREAPTPVDGAGFLDDNEFVGLRLMDVREVGDGVLLRWRVKNRR